jgi:tRNA threonylcarbamoyladenosine biosynthesis protein TsaB
MSAPPSLVLAFDTGSPLTSVAFARDGVVLAAGAAERTGSSDSLLGMIDAVLSRAGVAPGALEAICALRGPGSFTGLRIGLATALGLHQALGVPVAAMPTLRVLAAASDRRAARVTAVVDALRGEWFAQVFSRGEHRDASPTGTMVEEGPPRIFAPAAVAALGADLVIGFGADRLAAAAGSSLVAVEPPPLAGVAARLARDWRVWDPRLLTDPLYLRPAPATASVRT